MGSTFFKGVLPLVATGGLSGLGKSDFGMHPSNIWQRQPGAVLPAGPWSGQAPSLQGAQAGYTPQSYVKAAGGLLNSQQAPSFNTGGY